MSGAPQFDLSDETAYRAWRERKLAVYPARLEELIVPVADPTTLTAAEREALTRACVRANMAIYRVSPGRATDKDAVRALGRQLGLERLDSNYLADDDGITPLAVADGGTRTAYIPYTNRGIKWHTDGYYNPPDRTIRAMVLHCVERAESGGENRLLDHEIAYILLRDADPALVRALSDTDAMTIPARAEEGEVARGDQAGPVFSVDHGHLHMRYTARTRSIAWKEDAPTRAAVAKLEAILAAESPHVFTARLEPGMGLVCNNVIHDRSSFTDSPARKRLVYRARYYDRIAGT